MKTKQIGSLLLLLMISVSMASFAYADDYNETDNSNESVVTGYELEIEEPGNINAIDRAFDNLRLAFVFNHAKKAQKALEIAEERLVEAEKLAEEGNYEKAERMREKYEKFLNKSEDAFAEITSNGDVNESEEALREMARIQEKIEAHMEIIEEIKARMIEEYGENMTEEELALLEEFMERFQNRTLEMEQKALEKQEKIETKHKVLAELSDEELEELKQRIENEEGLNHSREERTKREEIRFQNEIEVRERNIERSKEKIKSDLNLTEEEKEALMEKIQLREENFEEFKERKEDIREKIENFSNDSKLEEKQIEKIEQRLHDELEKRDRDQDRIHLNDSEDDSDEESESDE